MQRRFQHGSALRRGLGALATLAALVPAGVAADTLPGVDENQVVDVVFSTLPDGQLLQVAVAGAGSKAAGCEVKAYAEPLVVEAAFGGAITCPSGVVAWTDSYATLHDDLLGSYAVDAACGQSANSCSDSGTLTPSLLPDQLTEWNYFDAYLLRGWTWGLQPPGCHATGNHLSCAIETVYPGVKAPVIVPRP